MITSVLDRAIRSIERILALAFVAAIALNFMNVIGRYGFGVTIAFADEFELFILVFMTFIGAVIVSWRHAHLRMDLFYQALPDRSRLIVRACELLITALLTGFAAYHSWFYSERMFTLGRRSDIADIPVWIPHGAVSVGFGLIAAIAVLHFLRAVRSGKDEIASAGAKGTVS